jgi:leucyl aminopeptidase
MILKSLKSPRTATIVQFLTNDTPVALADFEGKTDEVTIRYENAQTLIFCGIGTSSACTTAILRCATAKGIQTIQKLKRKSASFLIPALPLDQNEIEKAVIDGIILGAYKFNKYKTEKSTPLATIELINCAMSRSNIRKQQYINDAVNYTRDLINENASVITPPRLASEACSFKKNTGISVTVLDALTLAKNKLNLITAVGAGSTTPPVLIILEYYGSKRSKKTTAIVGKGVTFDSGGQNLKPTGNIETMRHDMAGASAVLGVFSAIAKIRPDINLIGIIPAVHNAIGSKSYFPGDVYTSYAGKTVEIWSTDAEGRLILADAIAYGIEKYHPDCIIDIATLTGGILSALGEYVAGLFSNNDELAGLLFNAGEKTGERLWQLPIYKEYCDSLKGDIGDLRNISKFKKGYAGSIVGAAFIKEFVRDIPWAHIDIAGTAFNESGTQGIIPQFGTGFGVRLLLSFLGI